ncbi:hypothetical protein LTR95_001452 [Oleoguttula sp. CCFEE 5521]
MLLSLPPSLIALIICFLDDRHVSAIPNPEPARVGDYIASGAGETGTPSSSANRTTGAGPVSTGTGSAYASSCDSALSVWNSNSLSWRWASGQRETSTFASAITYGSEAPGTTKVTSVITLCDGYPRVVGRTTAKAGHTYLKTDSWTNTITATLQPEATYPPQPCSIQPDDCVALSSAFDSSLSAAGFLDRGAPLCTVTSVPAVSYSTGSAGRECNNCMIVASTARLMYWPITTVEGSGDLCNKTASTITPTPTAPRSFVTDGITITSPSVAISFGHMSRADGCGRTINATIVPVNPSEVTSVRGFRALFTHHRFNFADLNYHCFSTNSTNYTIADGAGDDCYQQVPAAAYFGGLNNAVVYDQYVFRTMSQYQSTIWGDYQPQILPPQTMTSAIRRIWGDDCIIHPDGVWDPPIALTAQDSLALPSWGPGATTTSSSVAESTPASPVFPYAPEGAQETGIRGVSRTGGAEHFTAQPFEQSGADGSAMYAQASSTAADGDNAVTEYSSTPTNEVLIGTTVYTVIIATDGSAVWVGDQTTLTAVGTIPNAPVFQASGTEGSDTLATSTVSGGGTSSASDAGELSGTWSSVAAGAWVYSDSMATMTVSQGGPAVTIGSDVMSAADTGIVKIAVSTSSQSTESTSAATSSTIGTPASAASTQNASGAGRLMIVSVQALVLALGFTAILLL